MQKFTVKFNNVGRQHLSWSAELNDLEWDTVYRAIRASGALLSNNISLDYDCQRGRIYAGFQRVGSFEITQTGGVA